MQIAVELDQPLGVSGRRAPQDQPISHVADYLLGHWIFLNT
jgi:hypothetical protein